MSFQDFLRYYPNSMIEDFSEYMQMAVEQGKRSEAEDSRLHPKVGAVVVRNGTVFGSSYRGELGSGDHAEYTLLEKKLPDVDLKGAILFTTLEPCTSRKSHKPCSQWIIERKISTVVIGMLDPNPRIYSKGVSKLREHDVLVDYFLPYLREEIEADNREFIMQFRANPQAKGEASFDYTNNNGVFTIGSGDHLFETQWSKASDTRIHVYKDRPSVEGVAIARNARGLSDIKDASVYDMTSRVRTVQEGQFIVLRNINGYFAAIHVVDVKDSSRSDSEDALTFKYWILTDKSRDFSQIG